MVQKCSFTNNSSDFISKRKSTLNGVPNLRDVHVISDLLRHVGAEVEYKENTLTVDASNIKLVKLHMSL